MNVKMGVAHIPLLLLFMITASSVTSEETRRTDTSKQTDTLALLSFKKMILKDPKEVLSDWQLHLDPCKWKGITCHIGRVTDVDLAQASLVGDISFLPFSSLDMLTSLNLSVNSFTIDAAVSLMQIPSGVRELELSFAGIFGHIPENFFAECVNLEYVNLAFNNITGSLPENLFLHIDRLKYLDLSYNNISGSISNLRIETCDSLLHLDLSGNLIMGSLPASLANCININEMFLPENSLSGGIPSSFGQLKSLQRFDLSHNHLTETIPFQLGNACGSLVELKLSNNNITGAIPISFSSCSFLQTLDLSNNNLTGPFPDSILQTLSSLEILLLSSNKIDGKFPSSISFCKKLRVVDFSSNMLSSIIPEDICPGAASLKELRAPDNSLFGQIPSQLSKCLQLRIIDFSINYLNGFIPAELGKLQNLEQLIAWHNSLEGPIPGELGQCKKLKNLILNNNRLIDTIPVELFNCDNIEWISLTSNRLCGEIPTQFGKLTRLAVLQLANNSLTGQIPSELVNCTSLVWLDLNSNQLSGEIPLRLGRQLGEKAITGILSGNTLVFVRNMGNSCQGVGGLLEFAGIRPERMLQIPSLKSCDFTRLYSGLVLSRFTRYQTLEYLDLSYNQLLGSIPDRFGEMIALQVLDLSHNQLSGEIPESLGQLKNLGVFYASHNRLQGRIPDSFSNLTFLVEIDLSNNELTGQIPSRGQLSTLPASQYINNTGLCGVPLPECHTSPPDIHQHAASGTKKGQLSAAWWANTMVMGILISMASICILIIWAIVIRVRQKEVDGVKMLSRLQGFHSATTWRIDQEKEPLSINVATFQQHLKKLKFSQLIEATNGFSAASMIGFGGFGEVFKATLKDGSAVAIKKLTRLSCQGDREFTAEMETLGKIKHKNLVPLLGYCKIGEERLLVYEYMPNGSLEENLHGRGRRRRTLPWEQRKKIARGAAKGLCFLHHNCIPHIIHRDMKSSNVLLDGEMEACVSDFGMARLISALDTHLSVSTLAGTPGYVPPEYYQSSRCTAKGDVYSLGVILLEILTGKRPTDKEDFEDTNLVGWVKGKVRDRKQIDVIDAALLATAVAAELGEMLGFLDLSLKCVDDFPSRRPSMPQVDAMLRELGASDGS